MFLRDVFRSGAVVVIVKKCRGNLLDTIPTVVIFFFVDVAVCKSAHLRNNV